MSLSLQPEEKKKKVYDKFSTYLVQNKESVTALCNLSTTTNCLQAALGKLWQRGLRLFLSQQRFSDPKSSLHKPIEIKERRRDREKENPPGEHGKQSPAPHQN